MASDYTLKDFDRELAEASREAALAAKQDYLQQMQQAVVGGFGGSSQTLAGLANAANAAGLTGAQMNALLNSQFGQASSAARVPVFDPNTHPAFVMTLTVAKDMWAVRFGDKWVNRKELSSTEERESDVHIWPALAERLWDADCMERHKDWWRLRS